MSHHSLVPHITRRSKIRTRTRFCNIVQDDWGSKIGYRRNKQSLGWSRNRCLWNM